ncbi:LamG-like jellyroll fold domain-containing protein [Streptomyces sp. NPDC101158]|uniref:LamG-like jellyroll fold domain-containing protein n=1 Tax=Streptomyces sp. NPDC101158 TaxID=3366117 RepID=UPI0037F8A48D
MGVRDAAENEIRLYVDGALIAVADPGPADVSTGPLAVGRAQWGGGNVDSRKGSIGQVHAFDEALPSEEVAAPHASERPQDDARGRAIATARPRNPRRAADGSALRGLRHGRERTGGARRPTAEIWYGPGMDLTSAGR